MTKLRSCRSERQSILSTVLCPVPRRGASVLSKPKLSLIASSPSQTLVLAASTVTMSLTFPVNATPSSSSNFQSIFDTALKAYEKQTKRDLLAHPLASQLQTCDSPGSILAVLKGQVDNLDQARKSDERLTKWLSPTVNVLLAFSATLGEGVSLVSAQRDIDL